MNAETPQRVSVQPVQLTGGYKGVWRAPSYTSCTVAVRELHGELYANEEAGWLRQQ